jgi:hypothetical protein
MLGGETYAATKFVVVPAIYLQKFSLVYGTRFVYFNFIF